MIKFGESCCGEMLKENGGKKKQSRRKKEPAAVATAGVGRSSVVLLDKERRSICLFCNAPGFEVMITVFRYHILPE